MINDKGNEVSEYTLVEILQSEYSDFYKDVHGFRPRSSTDEQWNSEQWLQGEIDGLHAYLRGLGSTPEGRVELRQSGFTTSDKEADKAHSEAEARDRAEEDARYAEADRIDAVLAELLAPMSEGEQIEMEMK
jgi:hypothetical protein